MSPAISGNAKLVANNLSYSTPDGRTLFSGLSLALGRERVGLVGHNGSGKTTVLRLLTGDLTPSAGTIYCSGVVAVLPQDFRPPDNVPLASILGIAEQLAALERLTTGVARPDDLDRLGDRWDIAERAIEALDRLDLGHLAPDRPVGTVSGGEATRIALARAQLAEADVIVLDEPTNHLDRRHREWLYDFAARWSRSLLCVSHDRALLQRMDRIVELSPLGIRSYGGNYDSYRASRDAEEAAALRELESARAAASVAERDAREVRDRQAHREAQGQQRAKHANMPKILLGARKRQAQATSARVKAITEREVAERQARVDAARRKVEVRERPRFMLQPTQLPSGRRVLAIEDLTFHFDGAPRPTLQRFLLHIVGPERVAIMGANGSGKSTLLQLITGKLTPTAGHLHRLDAAEIGFLDQHGGALDPSLSVLANFERMHPEMDRTSTRHALARFLFSDDAALQRTSTLSGGERMRATLACVIGATQPPSLLVLDEPTNHLDLDAMHAFEDTIRDYDGALLVVSHDSAFLDAIGIHRYVTLG